MKWTTEYYQYPNRLAHLYFLLEVAGVEAWFVNLCFTDDHTHRSQERIVSHAAWKDGLIAAKMALGLAPDDSTLRSLVADVFLPGRSRDELG